MLLLVFGVGVPFFIPPFFNPFFFFHLPLLFGVLFSYLLESSRTDFGLADLLTRAFFCAATPLQKEQFVRPSLSTNSISSVSKSIIMCQQLDGTLWGIIEMLFAKKIFIVNTHFVLFLQQV
jgi:hypothetical protein